MRTIELSTVLLLCLFFSGCRETPDPSECEPVFCTPEEELIFRTGFEPTVVGLPPGEIAIFSGVDQSVDPPNDWEANLADHPQIGDFNIQYQGGWLGQRTASLVPDPEDSNNQVLRFWLQEPNVDGTKGRVQANLYGNHCLREIYHRQRIYLHPDFALLKDAPHRIEWLTLFEYWNNPNWDGYQYPFRISVNLQKPSSDPGGELFFGLSTEAFQNGGWKKLTEHINTVYPVPIGEWIDIEMHIREGGEGMGHIGMEVIRSQANNRFIFGFDMLTHHPDDPCPDGYSHFNPMKLYTSDDVLNYVKDQGGALEVLWDDFELWKDRGI